MIQQEAGTKIHKTVYSTLLNIKSDMDQYYQIDLPVPV